MDARVSAYNKGSKRYAGSGLQVVDAAREQLTVLRILMEGLPRNASGGYWVVHFTGIPVAQSHSPFDLVYLDASFRVLQAVEISSHSVFEPFQGEPSSALVLPPRSIANSKTFTGDRLAMHAAAAQAPAAAKPAALPDRPAPDNRPPQPAIAPPSPPPAPPSSVQTRPRIPAAPALRTLAAPLARAQSIDRGAPAHSGRLIRRLVPAIAPPAAQRAAAAAAVLEPPIAAVAELEPRSEAPVALGVAEIVEPEAAVLLDAAPETAPIASAAVPALTHAEDAVVELAGSLDAAPAAEAAAESASAPPALEAESPAPAAEPESVAEAPAAAFELAEPESVLAPDAECAGGPEPEILFEDEPDRTAALDAFDDHEHEAPVGEEIHPETVGEIAAAIDDSHAAAVPAFVGEEVLLAAPPPAALIQPRAPEPETGLSLGVRLLYFFFPKLRPSYRPPIQPPRIESWKPKKRRPKKLSLKLRILSRLFPQLHLETLEQRQRAERRAPRLPQPNLVGYFYTGGTAQPNRVRNLSLTGFYMETSERWIPGTVIRVILQMSDARGQGTGDPLTVHTRVVQWDEHGGGFEFVLPGFLE